MALDPHLQSHLQLLQQSRGVFLLVALPATNVSEGKGEGWLYVGVQVPVQVLPPSLRMPLVPTSYYETLSTKWSPPFSACQVLKHGLS